MPTAKNSTSIIFQSRDISLLRDLFESRVMTSSHAATLHFEGSRDAAKKRLQKLKASGYISERARRPTEPAGGKILRYRVISPLSRWSWKTIISSPFVEWILFSGLNHNEFCAG